MEYALIVIALLEGYIIWKLLKEVEELREKLKQISKLASPPVKVSKKPAVAENKKKKFSWKYYDN